MTHVRYEAMLRLKSILELIPDVKEVLIGVTVVGDEIETPTISIVEAIRPGETRLTAGKVVRKDTIDYLLTAWVKSTVEDSDSRAYNLMSSIEKEFAKIVSSGIGNSNFPVDNPDYLLGKLISDFSWSAPIVHPPADKIKSLAYLYIPFTMSFSYNANNPERQV